MPRSSASAGAEHEEAAVPVEDASGAPPREQRTLRALLRRLDRAVE